MNSEAMLRELDEAGMQYDSEYHEGLNGWLGWRVQFYAPPNRKDCAVLTMHFKSANGNDEFTRKFKVEPV